MIKKLTASLIFLAALPASAKAEQLISFAEVFAEQHTDVRDNMDEIFSKNQIKDFASLSGKYGDLFLKKINTKTFLNSLTHEEGEILRILVNRGYSAYYFHLASYYHKQAERKNKKNEIDTLTNKAVKINLKGCLTYKIKESCEMVNFYQEKGLIK